MTAHELVRFQLKRPPDRGAESPAVVGGKEKGRVGNANGSVHLQLLHNVLFRIYLNLGFQ